MQILLQSFAALLGIALHVFAVKLPSYQAKCIAGNLPFTFKGYFQCDWLAICSSVIACMIAILVMDEIIAAHSVIRNYIKFFMVFVGFTGSSLLIAAFGKANKSALAIIDKKTNIADATTGDLNPKTD